jgi:hypothetical protein
MGKIKGKGNVSISFSFLYPRIMKVVADVGVAFCHKNATVWVLRIKQNFYY